MAKAKDFFPGLKNAGFVIRGHHTQNRWTRVSQLGRQVFQVQNPCRSNLQESYSAGKPLVRGGQDRRMFDGGNPRFAFQRRSSVKKDAVVRFGSTRSPNKIEFRTTKMRGRGPSSF